MKRPLSFWSAADLLDPEPLAPLVIEKPKRQSRVLRGRIVRREGKPECADSPDEIAAMIAGNDL